MVASRGLPDHVRSEVERGLDIDVFVARRFRDGSDAPLHVLSVELELGFGDVVVVLLDGLGIVCAVLVGGGLGGEVSWVPAFGLAPFDLSDDITSINTFVQGSARGYAHALLIVIRYFCKFFYDHLSLMQCTFVHEYNNCNILDCIKYHTSTPFTSVRLSYDKI